MCDAGPACSGGSVQVSRCHNTTQHNTTQHNTTQWPSVGHCGASVPALDDEWLGWESGCYHPPALGRTGPSSTLVMALSRVQGCPSLCRERGPPCDLGLGLFEVDRDTTTPTHTHTATDPHPHTHTPPPTDTPFNPHRLCNLCPCLKCFVWVAGARE